MFQFRRFQLTGKSIVCLFALAVAILLTVPGCEKNEPESSSTTKKSDATIESGSQTKAGGSLTPAGDPIIVEDEVVQPQWDPAGIADFSFVNTEGETVTKQDLLGHHWAVAFIFTRCAGPCPKVTEQIRRLQDRLKGTDVKFVSITVDPDYDTPEKLTKYATLFEANPEQWMYLTGKKEDIFSLIIESFRMPVQEMVGEDRKPGYEVLHSTNILHVDDEGKVVKKYNALLDTDMVSLRKELLSVAKPIAEKPAEAKPAEDTTPEVNGDAEKEGN